MSLKRNSYKGIPLPDETYLIARPCFLAICYGNKSAAMLLSALLFRYNPNPEEMESATTFTFQRTQAELVEDMGGYSTEKSIHDAGIPGLQLFGYLDVDETTSPITYTLHLDRVREALEVYSSRLYELEKFLIQHVTLEGFDLNKKNFHLALEEVLIRNRGSSNSNREISNSRRGRKPKPGAASEAKIKTTKNNKNKEEQKEDAPHVASPTPLFDSSGQGEKRQVPIARDTLPKTTTSEQKKTTTKKTTSSKKAISDHTMLTPEGERVIEQWQQLRKQPIPLTEGLIKAANQLGPCNPSKEDLHEIERHCYGTDKTGWYKRGVKLWDIAREYEGWQSAREELSRQEAARTSLTRAKPAMNGGNGSSTGSMPISDLEARNRAMKEKYGPKKEVSHGA